MGISILFTGSVFAQIFDGDEETKSWVIDLWSPTNTQETTDIPSQEEVLSWDIGSALGIEEPTPEPTVVASSGGSSGGGSGGRLGTANYSLLNRSTLVTMERQAMIAKENESQMYASAPKSEEPKNTEENPSLKSIASIFDTENDLEMSDHMLIAEKTSQTQSTDNSTLNPIDIVDHVLIATAGRDDLVSTYTEPLSRNTQPSTPPLQAVKSSAPRGLQAQVFTGSARSILVSSEPFPIQKTHLLSWNGMDEDIAEYKLQVIQKIILNTLIVMGKIFFFSGIIGLIIALLFRDKIHLFRRNKVRQLTLFSLLK
jgi:hypothetical protein